MSPACEQLNERLNNIFSFRYSHRCIFISLKTVTNIFCDSSHKSYARYGEICVLTYNIIISILAHSLG